MKSKTITLLLACIATYFTAAAQSSELKDSLETNKATAYNPAALLRGKFPGVRISGLDGNINGDLNVNIRGINTLRGNSQPLWIIDGTVLTSAGNYNSDAFWQFGEASYSSTLNNLGFISPYDIESIEIIKDMSSSSIYGPDAANGIVIIKTKVHSKRERKAKYSGDVNFGIPEMMAGIFRPAASHNHHFDIGGSVRQSAWRVSGHYKSIMGTSVNQSAEYGGASINFETSASSALWFGFRSLLSMGEMSNTTGPSYFNQPSLMLLGRFPYIYPRNSEEGWRDDYDDNMEETRTTNSMFLVFNFTPNFKLKTTVGVDYRNIVRKIWFGNGTSFGEEMNGAASLLSSSLFNYNANAVLSYDTWIKKTIHLSLNAGADVTGCINMFNTMNGTDFFTHALRAEGLSIRGSKAIIHTFDYDHVQEGAWAKATIDYNDFLGANASLRTDFSSGIKGLSPAYSPAANLYANLKKITFPSVRILSTMKLSGGYGVGRREYYLPYQLIGPWVAGVTPSAPIGKECYYDALNLLKSSEWNIAFSIGVLDNRLEASIKYYNKETDDLFLIFDSSTLDNKGMWEWGSRQQISSRDGSIANRGYEFSFSAIPFKNKRLKWSLAGNLTYAGTQITSLDEADTFGKKIGNDFYANANALGHQVGELYGFLENADGSYRDITRDGVISEADKRLLGNVYPKLFGGASTVFSFGRININMHLDGAALFHIANLNSITRDRKSALSESYVEKGDFIRLSHVAIKYCVPITKKWLHSLTLSVSAQNLLTFSRYSGWNPDVNCFGRNVLSQGLDYGSYSDTRFFVFSASVEF